MAILGDWGSTDTLWNEAWLVAHLHIRFYLFFIWGGLKTNHTVHQKSSSRILVALDSEAINYNLSKQETVGILGVFPSSVLRL